MSRSINEPLWQHLSAELTRQMREWRLAHPKASLREIETELDTRLSHLRARLLEDLAHTSAAASWAQTPASEQPLCPDCQYPLDDRGAKTRSLQTHAGVNSRAHVSTHRRQYCTSPAILHNLAWGIKTSSPPHTTTAP